MFKRKIKIKVEDGEKTENSSPECSECGKDPAITEEQEKQEERLEQAQIEKESEEATPTEGTPSEEQPSQEAPVLDTLPPAEDELTKAKLEAAANYDKYLRAIAELENYKKRNAKERSDLIKYAGEGLAREILEIVDQLQLALKQESCGTIEEFVKGIRMVHDNLLNILGRFQIIGEDSMGTTFDPQKHEAMVMLPTDAHKPGTVVEEFKKPYFFKDKLLRAGQVVVAKELPPKVEEGETEPAEYEQSVPNDCDC